MTAATLKPHVVAAYSGADLAMLGVKSIAIDGREYTLGPDGKTFVPVNWIALQFFQIPVKTKNAANQGFGRSKAGMHYRAKLRRLQRSQLGMVTAGLVKPYLPKGVETAEANPKWARLRITVKRIAPRALDAHDGLRSAMKSVVDGIADALGFKNDRDPRLVWVYEQGRGRVREYAVGVKIEVQMAERVSVERAKVDESKGAAITGAGKRDHGGHSGRGCGPRRPTIDKL